MRYLSRLHHCALGHHVHDGDAELVQQGVPLAVTKVNDRVNFILARRSVLPAEDVLLIEVTVDDLLKCKHLDCFQLLVVVPDQAYQH